MQITHSQLLRDAQQYVDQTITAPKQKVMSQAELRDYQERKRKEYEDRLRMNRYAVGIYILYAKWEIKQNDLTRFGSSCFCVVSHFEVVLQCSKHLGACA